MKSHQHVSRDRKTPQSVLSAACLAGALALSGCGNTGDDVTPPADQPTTEEPTSQEPTAESSPAESSPAESPSDTATTPSPTNGEPGETEPGETEPESPTSASPSENTAIPTDAAEYADALIVAWGNGDRARMEQLATAEVLDVLEEYGQVGGPHWDQVGHDAGAGSAFVQYENTDDGTTLELRVQNEAATLGQEQAVVEAKF